MASTHEDTETLVFIVNSLPRYKKLMLKRGNTLRKKKNKDGFEYKNLRRTANEKFEKFRLNFSKLSSVTVFL